MTRFDSHPNVTEISVKDKPKENDVRHCLELNIMKQDNMRDYYPPLLRLSEIAVAKYQKDVTGIIFPEQIACEQFRLNEYRTGQDHFTYHVAVNSAAATRRFLVMSWFLNDVEQGGDVFFPHFNVRVQPKKGRLLVYPAAWMYPCSYETPLSNDKYVLGTYMHYL